MRPFHEDDREGCKCCDWNEAELVKVRREAAFWKERHDAHCAMSCDADRALAATTQWCDRACEFECGGVCGLAIGHAGKHHCM